MRLMQDWLIQKLILFMMQSKTVRARILLNTQMKRMKLLILFNEAELIYRFSYYNGKQKNMQPTFSTPTNVV
jgi:hypothetical protein